MDRDWQEGIALWLSLEGSEPRDLGAGVVLLPKVGLLDQTDSLNHALTLLSEQFEPGGRRTLEASINVCSTRTARSGIRLRICEIG